MLTRYRSFFDLRQIDWAWARPQALSRRSIIPMRPAQRAPEMADVSGRRVILLDSPTGISLGVLSFLDAVGLGSVRLVQKAPPFPLWSPSFSYHPSINSDLLRRASINCPPGQTLSLDYSVIQPSIRYPHSAKSACTEPLSSRWVVCCWHLLPSCFFPLCPSLNPLNVRTPTCFRVTAREMSLTQRLYLYCPQTATQRAP